MTASDFTPEYIEKMRARVEWVHPSYDEYLAALDAIEELQAERGRPTWIMIDVGCLECGNESVFEGAWTSEADAVAVARQLTGPCYTREGQRQVFRVDPAASREDRTGVYYLGGAR